MLIFFSTLLLLLGEHRTVASAGGAPGGAAATIATSAAAAAVGSPTAALRKSAGFIGTVHPSRNPVPGAAIGGLKAQDVFGFGASMICNEPSIGNWTLKENIEYHCRTASVNLISGLILPPTERGQVNNPLDKDPWVPLSEKVGMIQGAARFSKISAMCPQLTGIFIDDFLQQYIGKNVTKKPTGPCYNVTCPASRGGAAGLYGSNEAGWYCCPTPHNGGHCAEAACKKESDKNCACCTDPGSKEGCQGAPRCTASPIKRKNGTIPCNQGPTGPAKITLQDMKDIKAALQGKIVDPVTGVVDHSSTALTPHLKLGIIWYDFEMVGNYNWLQKDGLLDVIEAVTPWMWHQPKSEGADYPALLQKLRKQIPANMPVYPGVYIKNSAMGWLSPGSVSDTIQNTIDIYDSAKQNTPATIIFAGVWMTGANMNTTIWNEFDFEGMFAKSYYPYLGYATITVESATASDAHAPVPGATVTAYYGGAGPETKASADVDGSSKSGIFVTRRKSTENGAISFGGWAGRATPTPHTLLVEATGFTTQTVSLQLVGGTDVKATVKLVQSEPI